jgi:hypothetical protein
MDPNYVFALNITTDRITRKFVSLLAIIRGVVGWGTVLQVGRRRVWLSMVSLEFFMDIILPHYGPGVDSASNRNEYQ